MDRLLRKDTRAFYDALSDLIRVYQFRDRDRICGNGLSVTQCYTLETLARRSSLGLTDLAAHLYLDKSTMSRVIDALERKGYVRRSPDPQDGRASRITISESGRELHDRIVDGILAEEQAMLASFTPEVRLSMTKVLGELARIAERRMSSGGKACGG